MARINARIDGRKAKILFEYAKKNNITITEILNHAIDRLLDRDKINDPELDAAVQKIREEERIEEYKRELRFSKMRTQALHLPNNTMRRIRDLAHQSLLRFGYVDQDEIKLVIADAKKQYELLPDNIKRAVKTKMQKIYMRCKNQDGIEEIIGQQNIINRVKKQIADRTRTGNTP